MRSETHTNDAQGERHSTRESGRGAAVPTVFIAEDDPSTLSLLRDLAEDRGWLARGFTHLSSLRARLRAEQPALVILDDDLPDGSGGDLARELRTDPQVADVAVVVCTAAHPLRQAEIGAWAPVVSKPFAIDEIERVLDAAARRFAAGPGHPVAG
jgi:DNA-binding response OmpR family regulator